MASSLVTEEQLLCPVCLEVFEEPVSTPCGHNFCKSCLTSYWDSSPQCLCPVCKESFSLRPVLRVNTFIRGLSRSFTSLQLSEERAPARVLCDICTAPQRDAARSCVECLSSFCEAHLEPHHRVSGLRRHSLVEPLSRLEQRVCPQHQQLLLFFCTDDRLLLCPACEGAHSGHRTLPLQQAHRELRAELGASKDRVTSMIQERAQRVSSISQVLAHRRDQRRQERARSEQVLREVLAQLQTRHKDLLQKTEEQQQEADCEARAELQQTEQEISELTQTQTKLTELEKTQDPLLFLLDHPHRAPSQQSRAPSSLSLNDDEGLKETKETLSSWTSQLQAFVEKLSGLSVCPEQRSALGQAQKYAVDFRLDPATAHPQLLLSRDLTQVRFSAAPVRLSKSKNPKCFSCEYGVVADRGFSSGQFYFEVFVGQKEEWIVGVISESFPRDEAIPQKPDSQSWALYFRVDRFCSYSCRDGPVHRGKVERVGVFVDFKKGLVSFYDVKKATCIYFFHNCVFTERLFPFLNTADDEFPSNMGPMILVPVGQEP